MLHRLLPFIDDIKTRFLFSKERPCNVLVYRYIQSIDTPVVDTNERLCVSRSHDRKYVYIRNSVLLLPACVFILFFYRSVILGKNGVKLLFLNQDSLPRWNAYYLVNVSDKPMKHLYMTHLDKQIPRWINCIPPHRPK